MHVLNKYRTDGMNGIMPIEPLRPQALKCLDDIRNTLSELILNYCVDYGVGHRVRKFDLRLLMVALDEGEAHILIELEPCLWIGCLVWIVVVHTTFDVQLKLASVAAAQVKCGCDDFLQLPREADDVVDVIG